MTTLRKLSMLAALAGALAFPASAALAAKHGGGGGHHGGGGGHHGGGGGHHGGGGWHHGGGGGHHGGGGWHHGGGGWHGGGHVHGSYTVGRRYYGGVWYGHNRHYWRGRWYAYGVGPCWLATPIGYVWVCN